MLLNTTRVNSDNYSFWKLYNLIWLGIVCSSLIILGLITSYLTLLIVRMEKLIEKGLRRILCGMVLADFGFLICSFIYIEVPSILRLMGNPTINLIFEVYFVDVTVIGVNIFEMFRNWLTTLIALWRYIATNYPLKAKVCLRGKGFAVIIIAFIFSIIIRTPIIIRRISKLLSRGNVSIFGNLEPDFSILANHIHNMVDLFLLATMPILIILFCSIRTYQKIEESAEVSRKHDLQLKSTTIPGCSSRISRFSNTETPNLLSLANRTGVHTSKTSTASCTSAGSSNGVINRGRSQKKTSLARRQPQITKMLFIVVILFALMSTPQVIYSILGNLDFYFLAGSKQIEIFIKLLKPIVWAFSIGHSLSNFFVYIVYMPKYRTIIRRKITKILHLRHNSGEIVL